MKKIKLLIGSIASLVIAATTISTVISCSNSNSNDTTNSSKNNQQLYSSLLSTTPQKNSNDTTTWTYNDALSNWTNIYNKDTNTHSKFVSLITDALDSFKNYYTTPRLIKQTITQNNITTTTTYDLKVSNFTFTFSSTSNILTNLTYVEQISNFSENSSNSLVKNTFSPFVNNTITDTVSMTNVSFAPSLWTSNYKATIKNSYAESQEIEANYSENLNLTKNGYYGSVIISNIDSIKTKLQGINENTFAGYKQMINKMIGSPNFSNLITPSKKLQINKLVESYFSNMVSTLQKQHSVNNLSNTKEPFGNSPLSSFISTYNHGVFYKTITTPITYINNTGLTIFNISNQIKQSTTTLTEQIMNIVMSENNKY